MGRPRLHDEHTADALLAAAEAIIAADGPDALSVRGVASNVGTTTRAVYSVYGSKDGLLAALAAHGFHILRNGVAAVPTTSEPDRDLVEAGLVFRRYAVDHPSLFRIAFQGNPSPLRTTSVVTAAANEALAVLKGRIRRLDEAGRLDGYSVEEATLHFHAVCEGLAGLELRGLFPADAERHWKRGLGALIRGLAGQPPSKTRRPKPGPTRAR